MKLIEPTAEYCSPIMIYRQEFLDCGDSMDGTHSLRNFEDPEKWIEHCVVFKDIKTVPEGRVPSTQYIFVREEDNKIVGMLQIRHCFNDYLEKFGGHIGYSVAPSERRKGYASLMLKTALPKCKELGLDRVLITCDDDNEGSRRTILSNGGVYDSTVYEPEEKINLERYWIDLSGTEVKLETVVPTLEDMWFRESLLADEETMSYNHAWGGTVSFPRENWEEWYDWWIVNHDNKRYYRYIKDEQGFVGEIAYHYASEYDGYVANVIILAKYRGKGYGAGGLELLCAAAKENGIPALYDDIAIDNTAIKLFLKQGFHEEYRTEEKIVLKKDLQE